MKIIIDCEQERYPDASALIDREIPGWHARYTRVGYGWAASRNGARYFIRRLTDGLSITQTEPSRGGRS